MMFARLAAATALSLTIANLAQAQKITPSHVLQKVEDLNAELGLLLKADLSKVEVKESKVAAKKPRHVIQKAREVLLKAQVLRRINGLPMRQLKPTPVRNVSPGDVIDLIEIVLADVRELRPLYSVPGEHATTPLPQGKSPTDVYVALAKSLALLDHLGIPKSVPNDVYRIALTVINDVNVLRQAANMTKPYETVSGAKGKSPTDVYNQSYKILASLRMMSEENKDYAVPGGVVMPLKKKKATPADVLDVLNGVLAEISAMKVKLGANQPTELAPEQSGKTPSDAYDAASTALQMADRLAEKAIGEARQGKKS